MTVTVKTRKYQASHQRSPRGRGGWLFELRRHGELADGVDYFGTVGRFGLTGMGATTYGVALEAAKAKAREIGATEVVVLP